MELHRESLATAESARDRWVVANAHNTLGFAAWLQGDFELATAECTTALTMSRELGYVEDVAWSLISLGATARDQGAPERAAALLTESHSLSERIGFREGLAWSLEQLGLLALDRGDPGAADLLRRSLLIHRGAAGPLARHQRPRGSRGAGARPRRRRDGGPAAGGGTGDARADRHGDPAV